MNFDLSNLPVPMPTVLDLGHIGLAALVVLFLLIALLRGGKSPASESAAVLRKTDSADNKKPAQLRELSPDAALQLLTLLQKDARFVDFVKEDLGGFSDADIGAAARVVHEGSQKALSEYFVLEPILDSEEDSPITVEEGFNASEIRLIGNVVGEAPFKGTVVHRGWKATSVTLPKLSEAHDANIIASSEIEL